MATVRPLPDPGLPWVNTATGRPLQPFAEYMQSRDMSAWSPYTPIISAQTGTITTASATGRWARAGRWVVAEMDITITTVGTGANGLRATLPVTAASFSYVGSAREYAVIGKSGGAIISSGVGFGSLDTRAADATSFIAAGAQVAVSILYEAAS